MAVSLMGGTASADDTNAQNPEVSQDVTPAGTLTVDRLTTEYAEQPLGIDEAQPRLGWMIDSEGRDRQQSAYRVLVATSADALNPDDADVWDSGKVSSSATSQVVYDGPALEPRQRYHWTVQVWDADDNSSGWAEPTWWEMGLADDPWDASWIGRDVAHHPEFDDFTLEFDVTPLDAAFGVYLRADGTGDSYMWQLIGTGDEPVLRTHVFVGGQVSVIDDVPIGDAITADDFFDQMHTMTIEADGDEIITSVEGVEVDRITDDSHTNGTIGFRTSTSDVTDEPERALIHRVEVTQDDEVVFTDDFSIDDGVWSGGGEIEDGALLTEGSENILLVDPEALAAPRLRQDFELDNDVEQARLHVVGLGYHEVHLNGARVGDHVLDPAISDYNERAFVVTHDVTDHLDVGANAVGVELGRGFYGMATPSVWDWHVAPWHDDPKLLLQLEVDHVDGTTTTIISDDDWQAATGPIRFDSLLAGERHDARLDQPGWTTPGFDAAAWDDADVVDDPGLQLDAQMVQPIRVTDELTPVEITEPEPGVFVFDLGQNIAGWVQLDVEGDPGTQLVLHYGEKLREDGTVDNDDPLNHMSERYQVDTYTLHGEGPETFEPRFSYKGFQYVQVENLPGEPSLDDLTGLHLHTDVEEIGDFSSSIDLFDEVDRGTRYAILNNLHSMPTDTPMFEKLGWTADGQVMVDASVHNYDMPRVYTKWLDDMRDGQLDNGRIPVVAPTHGWGADWVVPEWSATYVMVAWDMYRYYGDTRVLADHYDAMRDYVDYELARLDDDGLSDSTLGDWAAPGYSQGPAPEGGGLTSTAYVHRAAFLLSEIAEVLGHDDDAADYHSIAGQVRDDLNAAFLDTEAELYTTDEGPFYRQTSNVLPLAWDLVPNEHVEGVVANLVDDVVQEHDGHLDTGVIGTKHLLRVLTEHGHTDVAARIATQDTYPSWGYWFANGATTPFEFWELESRSWGHMFLGTIQDWFYQDLAGLRTQDVGKDRHIEVAPHPFDGLEHASASTRTVEGDASSSWRIEGDVLRLDVEVPANTTATVRIPSDDVESVTEGRLAIEHVDEIEVIEVVDGRVVLEVGSGSYGFAVGEPPVDPPFDTVCDRHQGGKTFPDVPGSGHGFFIDCLAELGIVQGFDDGTYRPAAEVSRGQLATYVVNAIETATDEELAPGEESFPDVPATSTHGEAIYKLRNAGIIDGYEDGRFRPDDSVSRDQTARYVVNALELMLDESLVSSGIRFPDVTMTQYQLDIDKLATAEVIQGFEDGSYGPREPVTRGQMARFVANGLEVLATEDAYQGP